ncbi:hypothetical protein LWC34_41970 [Kibdelosporangium philippinense]|uniref:Uncharacterized protein n=1 Tax=Kibdelosporangium philippinense TaxID=211113 RepID=A0ABS8ZNK1_9PSEU|nr:hypothetical protein [Kibdelosporangium philippinense]MCE7009338.1 hypothetical protein [Kibdelosporangium philippinense]
MSNTTNARAQFSPDGLTEAMIDALIVEVADELADAPTATTALLDGTAREQRDRRIVQRRLGGMVRVLRVHNSVPIGTEAA